MTNNPQNTPFAPIWDYSILECENIIDNNDISAFEKFILEHEKQIIHNTTQEYQLYNSNYNITFDGGTNLGPGSLTSRSPFYNLWSIDLPVMYNIKNNVHFLYTKYLEVLSIPRREVWIQSWANVLRKGESISEHIHASHENTWLGGHVTISCENTSTFYRAPVRLTDDQIYESKNIPGKLTLFPDCIPHWTSLHMGEKERISIAFDIITTERHNQLSDDRKNMYVRFDYE